MDEGSGRRKAATCTGKQISFHASSGVRTHDHIVRALERTATVLLQSAEMQIASRGDDIHIFLAHAPSAFVFVYRPE